MATNEKIILCECSPREYDDNTSLNLGILYGSEGQAFRKPAE